MGLSKTEKDEFAAAVYQVVQQIPRGSVLTYGAIAVFIGKPQNSRLVAKVISSSPNEVPCHRVVNSTGRTAPGWSEQIRLLKNEGVTFKENGNVNLKKHFMKMN